MKKLLPLFALLSLVASAAWAFAPAASAPAACPEASMYFQAFDVFVDSGGTPLAAYQVELKDNAGIVQIVGVEGGSLPNFAQAPYYDTAAIQHERVIIGAYSTGADLPSGRTRVARIHAMIVSDSYAANHPRWQATLMTAGTAGGNKIDANVTIEAAYAAEGAGK